MTSRFLVPETTSQVVWRSKKQEGVLKLAHALAAGMTQRQIDGMVTSGAWWRPYRGVLIDAGVPVTPMQPVIAASFALGDDALGSHRLCLWMWGLLGVRRPPLLEFSVPRPRNPRLPDVRVYRVTKMPPASWKGVVPVTSPLRALLDTAAVAPDEVEQPLINGVTRKLFTPKAVEAEMARAAIQGKRGISALRAVLNELGVGRFTPSQLERRSRKLFEAAGLPVPQVEVKFGADGEYRLDFYWPEAGLVVEVDGWSIHASPMARRRDFRKQNRIVIGDRWILRYDWFDVVHDADRTAAEVFEAYAARTALLTELDRRADIP